MKLYRYPGIPVSPIETNPGGFMAGKVNNPSFLGHV